MGKYTMTVIYFYIHNTELTLNVYFFLVKVRASSVGHSRIERKKEIECETGQGKIMSFCFTAMNIAVLFLNMAFTV